MDLYMITQEIGKVPNRVNRQNTRNWLRRHNIQPLRRGWYDPAVVRPLIAEYLAKYKKHVSSS